MLNVNGEKRHKIAVIGLGDIAQKAYLPIVVNHPNIDVQLITRNEKVLTQLSTKYRINDCHQSFETLLVNKPDAAMIHTATAAHYTMAKQLIEADIPTLVDKPFSLEIDECRELISLAKSRNVPLFLAMNRRYAPLIQQLKNKDPIHVRWQKNRDNVLSSAKETIFNDFIHVVDGLRFLSGAPLADIAATLTVDAHYIDSKLANISFRFKYQQALFEGAMNRVAGVTEEKIEYFSHQQKTQLNNIDRGMCYQSGKIEPLGFSDWQSYLHTRGFEALIEHWLTILRDNQRYTDTYFDDFLATHELCQLLLDKVV